MISRVVLLLMLVFAGSPLSVWAQGETQAELVLVHEIEGVLSGTSEILLSPTDEHILYFADNDRLILYDLNTLAVVRVFEAEAEPNGYLTWSSDGRYIGVQYDDGVRVWDAANGILMAYAKDTYLAFGDQVIADNAPLIALYNSYNSGEAILYNFLWGEVEFTVRKEAGSVHRVAFQPEGNLLAIDYGSAIEVWNYQTNSLAKGFTIADPYHHWTTVMFSPDGRFLLIGSGAALGVVTILDSQTWEFQWSYTAPLPPISLTWTNPGDKLIAFFNSGPLVSECPYNGESIHILDTTTGELLHQIQVMDEYEINQRLDLADDEIVFMLCPDWINTLHLRTGEWSHVEGETVDSYLYALTRLIWGYALSRDQQTLVTSFYDGELFLWDVETSELIAMNNSEDIQRCFIETGEHTSCSVGPDGEDLGCSTIPTSEVETSCSPWVLMSADYIIGKPIYRPVIEFWQLNNP